MILKLYHTNFRTIHVTLSELGSWHMVDTIFFKHISASGKTFLDIFLKLDFIAFLHGTARRGYEAVRFRFRSFAKNFGAT